MSFLRQVGGYLGIFDEEDSEAVFDDYEDYDDEGIYEEQAASRPARRDAPVRRPPERPRRQGHDQRAINPGTTRPQTTPALKPVAPVTPVVSATVKPVQPVVTASVQVVVPETFADVPAIGDKLKQQLPVVMKLGDLDRELLRRVLDFASGLAYALGGKMERISEGVYLVYPANVEVPNSERERLRAEGSAS